MCMHCGRQAGSGTASGRWRSRGMWTGMAGPTLQTSAPAGTRRPPARRGAPWWTSSAGAASCAGAGLRLPLPSPANSSRSSSRQQRRRCSGRWWEWWNRATAWPSPRAGALQVTPRLICASVPAAVLQVSVSQAVKQQCRLESGSCISMLRLRHGCFHAGMRCGMGCMALSTIARHV